MQPSDVPSPLLVPGLTCWTKTRATKLAIIQDAGPTFAALADAMAMARRSIFILGWDIDSRTPLEPGSAPGRPDAAVAGSQDVAAARNKPLLPFLLACLARQPELEIFVLIWDFSIIYSFEREPWPRQQFCGVHPRLHFALAADHGTGGSHHQKVVVIDDEVAFTGGVDLTMHRWDTPDHLPRDGRRLDAEGREYEPFHDVHAAVAGPAAAVLGELARSRWEAATRRRREPLPPLAPSSVVSAWPRDLLVDGQDVEVGLARTLAGGPQPPVREIAELILQMIGAARRRIYAENQYLTSAAVVRALATALAARGGPEIVIVLPAVESGWMEQSSMGLLREEAIATLRQHDVEGRLRLVAPFVLDGTREVPVAVHAKVLVVDERIAKVGSANFSNRSLGLDSECDLAIEAVDAASAALVASVRDRLLGEHLGRAPAEIARRLEAGASLRELIDQQPRGAPRGLGPVPESSVAILDFTVFDGAMVDPPEPWSVDGLLSRAVPVPLRRRLARRWLRPLALVIGVLAVWVFLRRGPLRGWHLGGAVLDVANWLGARPTGPLLAFLALAVASSAFVPITLLATATLTVFGLWPGVPVAWLGAVLGATLSHAVGARWGQRAIGWIPARLSATLRRFLGRRPFWSVVLMRLLPVGNFGALNLLAGAFRIPRRSFVLGNAVGLLPGLLGLGVLVNRALAALRRPSAVNVALALIVAAALTALGVLARRRTGAGDGHGSGPAGAKVAS